MAAGAAAAAASAAAGAARAAEAVHGLTLLPLADEPASAAAPAAPRPAPDAQVLAAQQTEWLRSRLSKLPPGLTVAKAPLEKVYAIGAAALAAVGGGDLSKLDLRLRRGTLRREVDRGFAAERVRAAAQAAAWPGAPADPADVAAQLVRDGVTVLLVDGVAARPLPRQGDRTWTRTPRRIALAGPAGVLWAEAAPWDAGVAATSVPPDVWAIVELLQNPAVLKVGAYCRTGPGKQTVRIAHVLRPARVRRAAPACRLSHARCWPTSCTFSACGMPTWSTRSPSSSRWTRSLVRRHPGRAKKHPNNANQTAADAIQPAAACRLRAAAG